MKDSEPWHLRGTKAQARCLSPPLLLSSAQDDTDDRDLGLPMDLSSDLGSPDPLPACLGSLVCKMDIMTDTERKKAIRSAQD